MMFSIEIEIAIEEFLLYQESFGKDIWHVEKFGKF